MIAYSEQQKHALHGCTSTLGFAIDGEPALTAIRPGSDGMLVGLYGYEPDVDFDDIRLRAVISPEPTTQVGADEGRCE